MIISGISDNGNRVVLRDLPVGDGCQSLIMSPSVATLLEQIEEDAVNGRPVADTLRKAVILGGKANSADLREWATKELKGYGPNDELPSYRVVGAPICVDAIVGNSWIQGQRVSVYELPNFARDSIKEDVHLTFAIGEIEAIIRDVERGEDSTTHLSLPGSADLVLIWNQESDVPFQHIRAIYWSVSVSTLHGVVDQVRTALTELAAEMRAGTPRGSELPTAEVTNQAVSVAVHGKNARVNVTSQTSGGDATTTTLAPIEDGGWWTKWRRIGAFFVGAAGIAAAVLAYLMWLR